jgi:hypothetical protein
MHRVQYSIKLKRQLVGNLILRNVNRILWSQQNPSCKTKAKASLQKNPVSYVLLFQLKPNCSLKGHPELDIHIEECIQKVVHFTCPFSNYKQGVKERSPRYVTLLMSIYLHNVQVFCYGSRFPIRVWVRILLFSAVVSNIQKNLVIFSYVS